MLMTKTQTIRVLLVDDHEGVVERAAADVGQRQHLEHVAGQHLRVRECAVNADVERACTPVVLCHVAPSLGAFL